MVVCCKDTAHNLRAWINGVYGWSSAVRIQRIIFDMQRHLMCLGLNTISSYSRPSAARSKVNSQPDPWGVLAPRDAAVCGAHRGTRRANAPPRLAARIRSPWSGPCSSLPDRSDERCYRPCAQRQCRAAALPNCSCWIQQFKLIPPVLPLVPFAGSS
jgi:hypothetical protein